MLKNVRGMTGKQGLGGVYGPNTYSFFWNGNGNPSGMELWVDVSKIGVLAMVTTSDKQLKKEVVYRTDKVTALDEVLLWKPAAFKMKKRGIMPESAVQLGFIANDLAEVSPDCVGGKGLPEDYDIESDPNNSDAYFLNQVAMIAKLTQAIQAQQAVISEQSEIMKAMGVRLKDIDGLDG